MDTRKNHGTIDAYAKEAAYNNKEMGVVLLLNSEGTVVKQYGYTKKHNLVKVKELVEGTTTI